MRSEPQSASTLVWPVSISLAATLEIEFSFSSCCYLDVSVHNVSLLTYYFIHRRVHEVCSCGFPHSDILGSQIVCISPGLFAAFYVLLRLLVPRHSPIALCSLIIILIIKLIRSISFATFVAFFSIISYGMSIESLLITIINKALVCRLLYFIY